MAERIRIQGQVEEEQRLCLIQHEREIEELQKENERLRDLLRRMCGEEGTHERICLVIISEDNEIDVDETYCDCVYGEIRTALEK